MITDQGLCGKFIGNDGYEDSFNCFGFNTAREYIHERSDI